MKSIIVACLAAAVLIGCAASPLETRGSGTKSEHALKMAPAQAAGCMARNAENVFRPFSRDLVAQVRALPDGKSYEVVTRMPEWPMIGVVYLFEVAPSSNGSTATIWGPADDPEFRAKAISGC